MVSCPDKLGLEDLLVGPVEAGRWEAVEV